MTWALLGAMFAVWLAGQGAGLDEIKLATSICNYGMMPGELTHRAALGNERADRAAVWPASSTTTRSTSSRR